MGLACMVLYVLCLTVKFIFFVEDWDIDWYLGLDEDSSDCSAEETASEASFISSALD